MVGYFFCFDWIFLVAKFFGRKLFSSRKIGIGHNFFLNFLSKNCFVKKSFCRKWFSFVSIFGVKFFWSKIYRNMISSENFWIKNIFEKYFLVQNNLMEIFFGNICRNVLVEHLFSRKWFVWEMFFFFFCRTIFLSRFFFVRKLFLVKKFCSSTNCLAKIIFFWQLNYSRIFLDVKCVGWTFLQSKKNFFTKYFMIQ